MESSVANPKKGYETRPARAEDRDTLADVFNRVFGKDKDRRTLDWKYDANPHGRSMVRVALNPAGAIVGSLAFVPRKMMIRGEEHLTFLAADGMVFPEWQRKGIFVDLLNRLFEASWDAGAPLIIAFSGRRSVKGLIRTDWTEVGLVRDQILALRGTWALKRYIRRLPFTKPLLGPLGDRALKRGELGRLLNRKATCEIRRIERFDDGLAEAGRAALSEHEVLLVRDRDWLNWRYVDNPTDGTGRSAPIGTVRPWAMRSTRSGRAAPTWPIFWPGTMGPAGTCSPRWFPGASRARPRCFTPWPCRAIPWTVSSGPGGSGCCPGKGSCPS